jgi:hypothetical protein
MTEAAMSWSRMAIKARPKWVRNRLTVAMVTITHQSPGDPVEIKICIQADSEHRRVGDYQGIHTSRQGFPMGHDPQNNHLGCQGGDSQV